MNSFAILSLIGDLYSQIAELQERLRALQGPNASYQDHDATESERSQTMVDEKIDTAPSRIDVVDDDLRAQLYAAARSKGTELQPNAIEEILSLVRAHRQTHREEGL